MVSNICDVPGAPRGCNKTRCFDADMCFSSATMQQASKQVCTSKCGPKKLIAKVVFISVPISDECDFCKC